MLKFIGRDILEGRNYDILHHPTQGVAEGQFFRRTQKKYCKDQMRYDSGMYQMEKHMKGTL
jgi:hypothetical protein